MSGSVSSSILETEEDRKELLTLGRGALRKLLLETVVGSPSCKWSRSWGPVTQTGGNKRAHIRVLGGMRQKQGGPLPSAVWGPWADRKPRAQFQ